MRGVAEHARFRNGLTIRHLKDSGKAGSARRRKVMFTADNTVARGNTRDAHDKTGRHQKYLYVFP